MNINSVLNDFRLKFVDPLLADITRTLEVTCHSSGDENHGSNFIGNTVVLMGIEATSQFINPHSEEELETFRAEAKKQYRNLESGSKAYLSQRLYKIDGSQLAKNFMKHYFDACFTERREFGVPLDELIWTFRNPHAHTFYPHYRKRINCKEISGAVDWLYRDAHRRIGIRIAEIESQRDSWMSNLYKVERDCFRIRPQILFVFFKRAVTRFLSHVGNNSELQKQFLENYKRLSGVYDFAAKRA